jgi:hypothetical protein
LKNDLFIGHAEAGPASALLYTLIANCREHKIDAERYFEEALRRMRINATPEQAAELTPAKLAPLTRELQPQPAWREKSSPTDRSAAAWPAVGGGAILLTLTDNLLKKSIQFGTSLFVPELEGLCGVFQSQFAARPSSAPSFFYIGEGDSGSMEFTFSTYHFRLSRCGPNRLEFVIVDGLLPSLEGPKLVSWCLLVLKCASRPKRRNQPARSVVEFTSKSPGDFAAILGIDVPSIVTDEQSFRTQMSKGI